mgnify:FL=1|jgi:hypothetical protein
MGNAVSRSLILVVGLVAASLPAGAQEDPAIDVAAQVREQGYLCSDPVSARQEGVDDTDIVWVLTCGNSTYRVRLVPDQAAKVEQIN